MKTLGILVIFLISFQTQAACRCNCDFTDQRLCASSYDLDYPCQGTCPQQGQPGGISPLRTAYPIELNFDEEKDSSKLSGPPRLRCRNGNCHLGDKLIEP